MDIGALNFIWFLMCLEISFWLLGRFWSMGHSLQTCVPSQYCWFLEPCYLLMAGFTVLQLNLVKTVWESETFLVIHRELMRLFRPRLYRSLHFNCCCDGVSAAWGVKGRVEVEQATVWASSDWVFYCRLAVYLGPGRSCGLTSSSQISMREEVAFSLFYRWETTTTTTTTGLGS